MDYIIQLTNAGIEESEAKKEISILQAEIKDTEKIKKIIEERITTRKPIQYLIGKAYFMDFEVQVNEKVLIPRPETEILVEETVKRLLKKSSPALTGRGSLNFVERQLSALDIGTGSGIIAIALCKMIPNIKVTAIDINKEIIELAKENAVKNKVESRISFIVCDLFSKDFEKLLKSNQFNLIISNPPYVKEHEPATRYIERQPEVNHEPKIALYGSKENTTGRIYYERIINILRAQSPAAKGISQLLAFEIDPPLVKDLKELLNKLEISNFEIVKDYASLDRCLFIYVN